MTTPTAAHILPVTTAAMILAEAGATPQEVVAALRHVADEMERESHPALQWQDPTEWSCETTDGRFYLEERNGQWLAFKPSRSCIGRFQTKDAAKARCENVAHDRG